MPMFRIVSLSVALGMVVGIGMTAWHFGALGGPNRSAPPLGIDDAPAPDWHAPLGVDPPSVRVDRPDFDFGRMDIGEERSHRFTIHNVGGYPLRLRNWKTTCKCTSFRLETDTIGPGGKTVATLSWKPDRPGDGFRQKVEMETNDPRQSVLALSVHGTLRAPIELSARDVVFPRVASSQSAMQQIRVYSFRQSPLRIIGREITGTAGGGNLDVEVRPLRDDELTQPYSNSGALVSIRTLPGRPPGVYRQTLRLLHDFDDLSPIDVPITITVVPDVYVSGRGYRSATGLLDLGAISGQQGAARTVSITVYGPHRDGIRIQAHQWVPPSLRVTVGKPQPYDEGQAVRVPLTVELPKGHPAPRDAGPAAGDIGRVVLRTNHPDVPELTLRVSAQVRGR